MFAFKGPFKDLLAMANYAATPSVIGQITISHDM